jgi:hypothetical protein
VFLAGALAGLVAGWYGAQRLMGHHRRELFSRNLARRVAALGFLRSTPSVNTVRVLRDYIGWEPEPWLRRRALAIVQRMEAALG